MTSLIHLHPTILQAFREGEVEAIGQVEAIAEHLANCPACEAVYEAEPTAQFVRLFEPESALALSTARVTRSPTEDGDHLDSPLELPLELAEHPKWKWLGLLGAGGHGTVYLARHKLLRDQLRAIKIILLPLANQEAARRQAREFKTLHRIPPHENLPRIYDVEQAGAFQLIVMDLVLGQDLESLANQPLPIPVAVDYTLQVLAAIHHASSLGLVHRDLKPANLMITSEGIVKLLDFSLAKLTDQQDTLVTRGGLRNCGTVAYTSPEQARDFSAADTRSDLYSLGCTLYRLIAGHPPFGEHSGHSQSWQICQAHAEETPSPLIAACPHVPRALSEVVNKLLAKSPDTRFPDARSTAQALLPFADPRARGRTAKWIGRSDDSATAAQPKRRRITPLAILISIALLAAMLGIVLSIRTKSGVIEIAVDDPKVEVQVDDKAIDRSRIKVRQAGDKHWLVIEATPGKHEVTVSGKGYRTISEELIVERGRSAPLHIRLVREPVKPPTAEAKASDDIDRRAAIIWNHGGEWKIVGDELHLINGNGEEWLLFGDRSWTDYDFSLEVFHPDYPVAVSLLYRSPDDEHIQHLGYGWLDGRTAVAEYRQGENWHTRVLHNGVPLRKENTERMESGRWYKLAVRVRGEKSTLYFGDEEILTVEKNLLEHGRVGLRTWRIWQGQTRFRNLLVTDPDGKVLWKGLPELPAKKDAGIPQRRTLTLENANAWERSDGKAVADPLERSENDKPMFLATKGNNFTNYKLKLILAAEEGTEAFLLLGATQQNGKWQGITSRIFDDGESIRSGCSAENLAADERGTEHANIAYNHYFAMTVDQKDAVCWIAVDGQSRSGASYRNGPSDHPGRVGLLVIRGKVKIDHFELVEQ